MVETFTLAATYDQAQRLSTLLDTIPGVKGGSIRPVGGSRLVCYINIIDCLDDEGFYACVPEVWIQETLSWQTLEDGVAVTVDDLAGDGLKVDTFEGCDYFSVDPGCGLAIAEDNKVKLDLTDVVFDGLYWNDGICALGVNVECGITYVGEGIGVDY